MPELTAEACFAMLCSPCNASRTCCELAVTVERNWSANGPLCNGLSLPQAEKLVFVKASVAEPAEADMLELF